MKFKTNSKEVTKGDVFYALKGNITDGHDYIEEAINNGALLIYAQYGTYSKEVIIVDDVYETLLADLKEEYGHLFDKVKLIGVTGTNGKTTTAYLTYKCLNSLGCKSSYMGTIGFYNDDKILELKNTTPDILTIYEMIIQSYNSDCMYMCMEVSSHALKLNRVKDLIFEYGIYTNLTQDHLDFHNSIEEYANCKKTLFKQISNNGSCIINVDDAYSDHMMLSNNNNVSYGFNDNCTYQIKDYNCDKNYSSFSINYDNIKIDITSKLLGKYNVYNLTSVIVLLRLLNIDNEKIISIIKEVNAPAGRMDTIEHNNNLIIVDYAHTPDAVEKILFAVKEFSSGKIYSIIGCGGNRDTSKRITMSSIATSMSDYVILTNDNPRNENEKQIMKDMTCGLTNYNYEIEFDRKKAIQIGIDLLEENDVLLILGKGHENYQIIGNSVYHHDDKQEAQEYIKRKK